MYSECLTTSNLLANQQERQPVANHGTLTLLLGWHCCRHNSVLNLHRLTDCYYRMSCGPLVYWHKRVEVFELQLQEPAMREGGQKGCHEVGGFGTAGWGLYIIEQTVKGMFSLSLLCVCVCTFMRMCECVRKEGVREKGRGAKLLVYALHNQHASMDVAINCKTTFRLQYLPLVKTDCESLFGKPCYHGLNQPS